MIVDGRPRYRGGFSTKARAQAWIAKELEKIEKAEVLGIPVLRDEIVFEQMLPRWKTVMEPRTTENTLRGYVSIAERVLLPHFRGLRLDKIGRNEIENMLAARRELGAKPATLNRYLSVLSTIFSLAVDLGLARESVVRSVPRAREKLLPPRYLSREDEARLLAALPGWLRTPVLVALDTGLRAGEIGALKRRDVDLRRRVVTVRESKNREPREVGMTQRLQKALGVHMKSLPSGEDQVFRTPSGVPFARQGYRSSYEKAVRRAGIEPFRFHDLRHACGVRLAEAGATPAEIAAFLGHKTLDMTLRYIRHAPRDAARSVARLLDEDRHDRGQLERPAQ